ncbi:MAG: integrase [Hyphomicrobiales bacterium]|nr:integrase [Hyphomicrobiales bacterium]
MGVNGFIRNWSDPQLALTDVSIRAAKPKPAQYKLYDEGGLVMLVKPSGGKLWRLKYRFNGKEQQLTIGRYPDVGLKEARARRDTARKAIASGENPAAEKRRNALVAAVNSANTFQAVADELITKRDREGQATATLVKTRWLLSLLSPVLGTRPIAEITAAELLAALTKVDAKGRHETASRMRTFAGAVFRYAIATTRAASNPAAELKGALISPKAKHRAAVLDPDGVGGLLRGIDDYDGQPTTKFALRLAPHVFVRPGELRHAEWKEIDFEHEVWRIPAGKMKMKREHAVPLSRQALAILQEAKNLSSTSSYVFPSLRSNSRPMSENTLNAALRRLGYSKDEMTAHGFRSIASTLLNESGKWSVDAIERALAHQDGNAIRAAYNRGQYWQERVEMAQWWSDYIDVLRTPLAVHSLNITNQITIQK